MFSTLNKYLFRVNNKETKATSKYVVISVFIADFEQIFAYYSASIYLFIVDNKKMPVKYMKSVQS